MSHPNTESALPLIESNRVRGYTAQEVLVSLVFDILEYVRLRTIRIVVDRSMSREWVPVDEEAKHPLYLESNSSLAVAIRAV